MISACQSACQQNTTLTRRAQGIGRRIKILFVLMLHSVFLSYPIQILCYSMLSNAILFYVLSCHLMLSHVVLSHAISCYLI